MQFELLRGVYLKRANKFYRKEGWKIDGGYAKGQAYVGSGLTVLGTGAAYLLDSPIPFLFAAAGAMNVGWAFLRKRKARKDLVRLLEKRTMDMSYEELQKRVKDKDYEVPEPSEEENQEMLKNIYAGLIVSAVAQKEQGLVKHPWTIAGFCILGSGWYTSSTSSPVGGGMAMTLGGLVILSSQYNKIKKIKKLAIKVNDFLNKKGYDFFQNYALGKDPYDFYKRFIEPETEPANA